MSAEAMNNVEGSEVQTIGVLQVEITWRVFGFSLINSRRWPWRWRVEEGWMIETFWTRMIVESSLEKKEVTLWSRMTR